MTSMEQRAATERLFNAIEANDFAGAVRAMDAGASLSAKRGGLTPLLLSIDKSERESSGSIARSILRRGPAQTDVDRNREDETALHKAARIRWPDVAEALLAAGFDPNVKNASGDAPLAEAAFAINLPVVAALLADARTDAALANERGIGALHMCLGQWLGKAEDKAGIVRALVGAGANVNQADCQGGTPLMCVCLVGEEGALDLAKLLLELGADIHACAQSGATAEAIARSHGRCPELGDFLSSLRESSAIEHALPLEACASVARSLRI